MDSNFPLFNLNFVQNNVFVNFVDPATKPQILQIDENWESKEFANAIVAQLANYYPVQDAGVYLHKSPMEILNSIGKDDNCGYFFGLRAYEVVTRGIPGLFEKGEVSYKFVDEIAKNELYRLRTNGFETYLSHVEWVEQSDTETDFVTHNRAAINLIRHTETLRKAAAAGMNVQLHYWPDDINFFDAPKVDGKRTAEDCSLAAKYEAAQRGDMDALKTMIAKGVSNKQARRAVRKHAALAEAAAQPEADPKLVKRFTRVSERLAAFKVTTVANNELTREELIGQSYQIVVRGQTLTTIHTPTEDTVDDEISGIKAVAGKIVLLAKEPVPARKPATRRTRRNEPAQA